MRQLVAIIRGGKHLPDVYEDLSIMGALYIVDTPPC
jgi:hypothetical protein